MKISVIVLNYGAIEHLLRLFDKLKVYHKSKNECGFEISYIIVDNFTSQQVQQQLSELVSNIGIPTKLILNGNNIGYGAGNNVAIREAIQNGADYVLLLNPDLSIAYLQWEEIDLEQLREFDLFTFRLKNGDIGSSLYTFSPITFVERNFSEVKTKMSRSSTPVYPSGACLGIKTDFLLENGFLSEKLFLYYEEVEYVFRFMRKTGVFPSVIVLSCAKFIHIIGSTHQNTGAVSMANYFSARARLLVLSTLGYFYLPGALSYNLVKVIRLLASCNFAAAKLVMSGMRDGFIYLFKKEKRL